MLWYCNSSAVSSFAAPISLSYAAILMCILDCTARHLLYTYILYFLQEYMICQIKLTNVCSSLPILCLEYVMLASNTRSAYVSKTEYTIPISVTYTMLSMSSLPTNACSKIDLTGKAISPLVQHVSLILTAPMSCPTTNIIVSKTCRLLS